ncbi:MAG: AAA family ATPase [Blastocatellia bacterium]|nr:AAA family ATPase [Blastocatellia bacterium]
MVCPVIASPTREYTQKIKHETFLTPIWMTAKLLLTGELTPSEEPYIWIPRELLEPNEKDNEIIGDVDEVDRFLEQNPYPLNLEDAMLPLRWSDVWNYANKMLLGVTGFSIEDFSIEGYTKNNSTFILPEENAESDKIRLNIIKLYDYLREKKSLPQLLLRFASLQDNALKPLLTGTQNVEKSSFHYGQMRGDISLSPSQREALHHFLTLEEEGGEILAINGPPGTGKTTLLQSVVATMWIEAALAGKRQPPIIVATSTNNQAVTNVIEDFAVKSGEDSVLGNAGFLK